jgi:5-methylcytosine-specific restriction endonuclease McrA
MAVQAYRQRKYSQTPPNADKKLIFEIYNNCPKGYEVDHIIPISKGGLHHQDNLQYLTAQENRKKSNKLDYF